MKKPLFEWIAECCTILGKEKTYGAMLLADPNWRAAWEDDFTPEMAIAEFKVVYPNGYPKELEDEYLS